MDFGFSFGYLWASGVVLLIAFFVVNVLVKRIVGSRPHWILRLFGSVIISIGLVMGLLHLYVYQGFGPQGDIYRRGSPERPWISITFDDGPHPTWTPMILDILEEYDVPAAFFMVGSHVTRYPETALLVAAAGHELGNHTYDHRNVPTLSTAELSAQVMRTTLAILEVTGEYPKYLRPPRGMYDVRLRRLSEFLGQDLVLWSLSGQDWRPGTSASRVARTVVNQARPGDILLFHDSGALVASEGASRQVTVDALPFVIEGIRSKGLEFVPLSKLLQYAEPETDEFEPALEE